MGIDCFAVAFPAPVGPDGEVVDWPNPAARAELVDRVARLPDPVLDACYRAMVLDDYDDDGLQPSERYATARTFLEGAIDKVVSVRPYAQTWFELNDTVWYLFVDTDAGGVADLDEMNVIALSGITVEPLRLGTRRRPRRKGAVLDQVPPDALRAAFTAVRQALAEALESTLAGSPEAQTVLTSFDAQVSGWAGSAAAASLHVRADWAALP